MDKLEINFTPKDTANHIIEVLKVNIESLYYGLRLIESNSVLPERLNSDDDFFHFQIGEPLSESDLKNNLRKILLQKSFEDLIKGVTLSLCDAYLLINFRAFLCREKTLTMENIEIAKKDIYKTSHRKNFPTLVKEISDAIGENLPVSKELISINQTRNCLVHRKGIVYPEKDINDSERGVLVTRWLKPFLFQNDGTKEVEMIGGGIVTHESPAFLKTISQEKTFQPYEVVTFSYKEVLELAHTCYFFANGLVEGQIKYLKKNTIDSISYNKGLKLTQKNGAAEL